MHVSVGQINLHVHIEFPKCLSYSNYSKSYCLQMPLCALWARLICFNLRLRNFSPSHYLISTRKKNLCSLYFVLVLLKCKNGFVKSVRIISCVLFIEIRN